ncbi:tRNA (guanine(26)-N(2))-dimethyltransferase [Thermococcus argininiproducens]|uniref:tRNA (guanine(26)-N(2))-dimethyltransferase n=1 Tax=Thermococcus argininiproducens TaxID=2866384 RepID=A0A9E7SBS0_9EURY|nr:tRNA (guanine(10)-N(2))-dimethyltransferase [Thermococcus argininiproducens]USG99050.1 tRNA (guanine(26)-N(2))-dimethyltransferase [Thermococcus argininiproducens]
MKFVNIKEGKAEIFIPKAKRIYDAPVFYNPAMTLNRDLSVLVLRVLNPKTVLDALSATGIRGIRYALETNAEEIWLNDINPDAFKLIIRNLKINFGEELTLNDKMARVKGEKEILATNKDANLLMAEKFRYFDFVDLDPFGSPMEFLDSTLRSVKRKGVLAVTATDTAPLCGAHPKACLRKYNSKPLRGELCHESGLRILIGAIVRYAVKYDLGINVLFAYYKDHYFRAFLQLKDGAKEGDKSLKNMGYVYFEPKTGRFEIERNFLPSREGAFGPLWLGPLKEQKFIEKMIEKAEKAELPQKNKLLKFLSIIKDELNIPFFYDFHALARRNSLEVRKLSDVCSILQEKGHKSSRTHFSPTAIKTDAPFEIVLETLKLLQ